MLDSVIKNIPIFKYSLQFVVVLLRQCCNLLLVETLKDPLSFRVSDQTIPKQQHVVQVSVTTWRFNQAWRLESTRLTFSSN